MSFLDPAILARVMRLGLRARKIMLGTISGAHRSPLHGVSVEFADYREYVPGDDLKRLDWRAYARSERFHVKRYEEESNLRATLLLDASASMRYGGPGRRTKFECAATLVATLAALCVRQRDAVGLALVDRAQRTFLRPAATNAQLAKILDALDKATPDRDTDLGAAMAAAAEQIPARGLVVVVSDLLTDLDAFHAAIGKMRYKGHEVLVFHVLDRDELELPFNDSVIFRDIEGDERVFAEPWAFRKAYRRAMQRFVAEASDRCRAANVDYLLLRTDDDLGAALAHYLHRRTGGNAGAATPAGGGGGGAGGAA